MKVVIVVDVAVVVVVSVVAAAGLDVAAVVDVAVVLAADVAVGVVAVVAAAVAVVVVAVDVVVSVVAAAADIITNCSTSCLNVTNFRYLEFGFTNKQIGGYTSEALVTEFILVPSDTQSRQHYGIQKSTG